MKQLPLLNDGNSPATQYNNTNRDETIVFIEYHCHRFTKLFHFYIKKRNNFICFL